MKSCLIQKEAFLKLVQHERFVLPIREVAEPIGSAYAPAFSPVLEPPEGFPEAEAATWYLGAEAIGAALKAHARDEKVINQTHWSALAITLNQEEWDQLWTTNPHRVNVSLACLELGLC